MKKTTSKEFLGKKHNILGSWLYDINKANIAKGFIKLKMPSKSKGNLVAILHKHFWSLTLFLNFILFILNERTC